MSPDTSGIHALCARFHIRAQVLGLKAKGSASALDAARLNGMASALQWAAQELSVAASRAATAAARDDSTPRCSRDSGNGHDEPGKSSDPSAPTRGPGSRKMQP